MLELNSIAGGVLAADAMLKAAHVSIRMSQPICPGKYAIIINGTVADVKTAIESGTREGGSFVIDSVVIPRIHESVLPALSGCVELDGVDALGVIETFSVAQALLCADNAVKSADVTLMDIRLAAGLGGKAFVLLTGSVSSVREAVSNAASGREDGDMICNVVVIPSPHSGLSALIE